ncbi:MAG: hypothetical protein ACQES9_10960, partial [Myxococcota bacterium]
MSIFESEMKEWELPHYLKKKEKVDFLVSRMVTEKYIPNLAEIRFLLSLEGELASLVYNAAHQVQLDNFENKLQIRGILEFSNIC